MLTNITLSTKITANILGGSMIFVSKQASKQASNIICGQERVVPASSRLAPWQNEFTRFATGQGVYAYIHCHFRKLKQYR